MYTDFNRKLNNNLASSQGAVCHFYHNLFSYLLPRMPSIQSLRFGVGSDEFSMLEPAAISNDEYESEVEIDDEQLLPRAAKHRHRRRHRSFILSCIDSQSENSNDSGDSGVKDADSAKITHCCAVTKSLLATVLANVVVSVVIILLTIALCMGLGAYALFYLEPKPFIDKSLESFQIPNHLATRKFDALQEAQKELKSLYNRQRSRRQIDDSDLDIAEKNNIFSAADDNSVSTDVDRHRRQTNQRFTQTVNRWKIQIVYVAHGDSPDNDNIFTAERLAQIHQLEMSIMHDDDFQRHCYIDLSAAASDPNLDLIDDCAPLNSLLTYFYPSVTSNGHVHYDGLGTRQEPIDSALSLAMTSETFYWFVDDSISSTNRKSKLLRTEVHFGAPLEG